jgi:uncharacterized protein YaeQ
MKEEYPVPPELQKKLPYRKRFPVPKGLPKEKHQEAYEGWVMERVFMPRKIPTGCWYSVIDYIKFDDGSHALRLWYEKWDEKAKNFKVARGMFLREGDIEELKKGVDKTFAIKTLLRKFVE